MQNKTGDEAARSARSLTPHDSYFRYVFQQPEPARDLILNVLRLEPGLAFAAGRPDAGASGVRRSPNPAGQGPALDKIVSVTPASRSYVDEKLREHRSDLLVTLRTAAGRELAVYLLFEHKARNEPDTIFQLMRYNAMALAHLARERRKARRRPPPIISVVVYNGPGKWSAATELSETLDYGPVGHETGGGAETGKNRGDGCLKELHRFRYLVFDVELGMDEHFVGGPVARTALQAMYAASRKLGRPGVLAVVRSLTQQVLPGPFREATFQYLAAGREDNIESIVATLREEGYTEMGAPMISYAEKKHREGKTEGFAEALIRLLQRRFPLDPTELAQVREVTDTAKLQAALDEIIESEATRDSVLEKLR